MFIRVGMTILLKYLFQKVFFFLHFIGTNGLKQEIFFHNNI